MEHEFSMSFPHMGNYCVPIKKSLAALFPESRIIVPPPMTKRTVELGSRYSPDFICSPFKYNIGNFIEALENGANVLFQSGTGCRYGYYGEVQEQILRDLGYNFKFICFSSENLNLEYAARIYRELGGTLKPSQLVRVGLFALMMVRTMDRFEYYMRENIGFETVPGSFEKLHRQFLEEMSAISSMPEFLRFRGRYLKKIKRVKLKKPESILRVGIVGELFTIMEPFSNFYIEKELAKSGISVSRKMSASFLFSAHERKSMKNSAGYLKYMIGANGPDSVAQARMYARKGYDGIIHIKAFGCTPELNATPALQNLGRDMNIPILHLSFDSHTGETGVQTRLEAFTDMILMRRDKKNAKGISRGGYRFHFN